MRPKILSFILIIVSFLTTLPLRAQETAPCPSNTGAGNNEPPNRTVFVQILEVIPLTRLDPELPLINPYKADIYGYVKIGDSEVFLLPKKAETDSPDWDRTDGYFTWTAPIGLTDVPVSIEIKDSDSGSG